MKSYLLGFIGLCISFILLYILFRSFPKKDEKPTRRKIIIWSIIGTLTIITYFSIGLFFYKPETEKIDLISTIIFSLGLTPLLEEIVYRRIILQYFINLKKRKIFKIDFIIPLIIGFAFILPNFIYYYLMHIGTFSIKEEGLVFLLAFLPLISIATLRLKFSKLNGYIMLGVIIISQAFLFTLSHGDYASKIHIITGLVYGILYLQTESIIPPLIAHYLWNTLIFVNNL
ncbi:MAG: CPBP family glutamic-type intramembrane protease [Nanoarchaeota archaeon]